MMTSSIIVQNFSYINKFFARNSKLDSIFATFLRKSFLKLQANIIYPLSCYNFRALGLGFPIAISFRTITRNCAQLFSNCARLKSLQGSQVKSTCVGNPSQVDINVSSFVGYSNVSASGPEVVFFIFQINFCRDFLCWIPIIPIA